jgi:hypothetical protein
VGLRRLIGSSVPRRCHRQTHRVDKEMLRTCADAEGDVLKCRVRELLDIGEECIEVD